MKILISNQYNILELIKYLNNWVKRFSIRKLDKFEYILIFYELNTWLNIYNICFLYSILLFVVYCLYFYWFYKNNSYYYYGEIKKYDKKLEKKNIKSCSNTAYFDA